nr:hypothetical protein [Tanacetum cinerariifolium]
GFNEGVYWNNAIHWLTNASWMKFSHFKLDIENELPVLKKKKFPATFDRKSDFKAKMYESRGCLLLLGKDYAHSRRLNIYEMRNGYH